MLTDTSFLRNPHYHRDTDIPDTLDYARMALVVVGIAGGVARLAKAATGPSMRRSAAWLLAATGALVSALFFQQSWAMFYVPFCFVTLFRADRDRPEPGRLRLLATQGTALVLSLAIAVAAMRYAAERTERSSLTQDALGKLMWFSKEPLVNAASLFQITPSHASVALVGAVIAIGAVAFLLRRNVFAALCLLGGVALLPLAYLPNLLTAESWASYLSIGPLSALILVLVVWAALGIMRAVFRSPRVPATAFVVGLAGCSCGVARANVVTHIIAGQVAERELFRAQLLQAARHNVTAAHIVQAPYDYWPARTYRYEDFGVLSSCADWCPEPMFRLMSAELPDSLAQRLAGLPVTWGFEPMDGDNSELLQIDMRLLREVECGRS